jgi:predicted DNA-binding protein YlxM (UPF0122 family)
MEHIKSENHDEATLEHLFGNTATARVLDFMRIFSDWDYSKQDIAKNSDVSFRHASKAIEKLEKLELIRKTRNVGRAQMYQYNMQNSAARLLEKFAWELACQEGQKIADQEIAKEEAAEPSQTETPSLRQTSE